ncbi:MAG: glycosyltransferase [Verrucomicrobiota bacterium]
MRIAYLVHQYLPAHIGGTELYTRDLAIRSRNAGHEVCILTHEETNSLDDKDFGIVEDEHEGLPVFRLRHNLGATGNVALCEHDNAKTGAMTRAVLEKFQPDLVHILHLLKLSGTAMQAAIDLGIPCIVTLCDFWAVCPRHSLLRWDGELCRGPRHRFDCMRCFHDLHGVPRGPLQDLPEKKMWSRTRRALWFSREKDKAFIAETQALGKRNRFLRETLLQADRIIALSAFLKDIMISNKYPGERIMVCNHGLDTTPLEIHRAKEPNNDIPVFTFIGGYSDFKGLPLLLKALAGRPDLNLSLQVFAYGEAPPRGNTDSRVTHRGTFPPLEIGEILAASDFLVVPSRWYENEPLVVKAARYVGLPVITGDIGCLPGMVRDDPRSRIVSPHDSVEAWGETLAACCQEVPQERVAAKVKTIDENHSEMLALYDEVATERL